MSQRISWTKWQGVPCPEGLFGREQWYHVPGKKALWFHNQERDRDYFLKCPLCVLSPVSLTSVKISSRIKFLSLLKWKLSYWTQNILWKSVGKKKKEKEIQTERRHSEEHSIEGSRITNWISKSPLIWSNNMKSDKS